MQKEVFIRYGDDQEVVEALGAHEALLAPDVARRWLDEQFIANECEPLRASGKVLTADKLLSIAATVGLKRFTDDAAFRHGYALAAVSAMGKPVLRVDVENNHIGY